MHKLPFNVSIKPDLKLNFYTTYYYTTKNGMMDIIQVALNKVDDNEKSTILTQIINGYDEDTICDILYNILIKYPNVINRIVKINDEEEFEVTKEELVCQNDGFYSYYTPEWEPLIHNEITEDIPNLKCIIEKQGYWNVYNNLRLSILWRMENEAYSNYVMSFEDIIPIYEQELVEPVLVDETTVEPVIVDETTVEPVIVDETSILTDLDILITESKIINKTDDEIIDLLIEYSILNELNNPINKRLIVHSKEEYDDCIKEGKKLCWDNEDCNLGYCSFMHIPMDKISTIKET